MQQPPASQKKDDNPWNDPPSITGKKTSHSHNESHVHHISSWTTLVAFLALLATAILAGIGVVHLTHCWGA